eukprot:1089756-Pelagomonas_calceolata.AAC.3
MQSLLMLHPAYGVGLLLHPAHGVAQASGVQGQLDISGFLFVGWVWGSIQSVLKFHMAVIST